MSIIFGLLQIVLCEARKSCKLDFVYRQSVLKPLQTAWGCVEIYLLWVPPSSNSSDNWHLARFLTLPHGHRFYKYQFKRRFRFRLRGHSAHYTSRDLLWTRRDCASTSRYPVFAKFAPSIGLNDSQIQ